MSESTVDSKKKPSSIAKTASKATSPAAKTSESVPKASPPKAEKIAAPAKASSNITAEKSPVTATVEKVAASAPVKAPAAAPATKAKPAAKSTEASKAQLPDQDAIDKMVNEAAYYLAEKRNFAPGYEEEDWAAAKKQIMTQLKGAKKPKG